MLSDQVEKDQIGARNSLSAYIRVNLWLDFLFCSSRRFVSIRGLFYGIWLRLYRAVIFREYPFSPFYLCGFYVGAASR